MARALELSETMRGYDFTRAPHFQGIMPWVVGWVLHREVVNMPRRQEGSRRAGRIRACDAKALWWCSLCAPLLLGLGAVRRVEMIEPGHPIRRDAACILAKEAW